MKLPQTERGKDLLALGVIAVVLVALLWPVTFGGKLLLPADMLMVMQPWQAHAEELGFQRVHTPFLDSIQQAYPWRKFAAEQLRQNTIPLWNPYTNCGMPFVANNQSACFYPETWLFALMPPEHAFGWAALLSLLMGGTFMFAFLRALGLRRTSALAGVMPFLLCGFMVGWMLLPTVRAVPMWLPLMLLCVERIVSCRPPESVRAASSRESSRLEAARTGMAGGRSRLEAARTTPVGWAAVLALATGMKFLAGHLHVSVFVLLIVAAYALFRLVQKWRGGERGEAGRGLAWIASGVVVGTGLAMLQLLPVLELVGMSPRSGGQSFASIRQGGMVPAYLLTALLPNVFGNPVDYNFWGAALSPTAREWVETAWYSGLAVLVLGIVAVAWRKAGRGLVTAPTDSAHAQTWFWLATWLGGVGLAWGTGLYYLLYLALPPLRQLPGVSRAVYICCFAGAVLAAYGYEALSRRLEAQEHGAVRHACDRVLLVLGLLALAGGVGVWLYTGGVEAAIPGVGTYTLLQLGGGLGLLIVAALCVAVMTWVLKDRVPPGRILWGKLLLLVLLTADLFVFAQHFLPAVPSKFLHAPSRALDTMRRDPSLYRMTSLIGQGKRGLDRMPPNLPMAFGFQDLQGSDSLVFRGYTDLWNIIPKDTAGNPMADSPLLDMLNCKYLLTSLDLSKTSGWRKVTGDEVGVWENMEVLPRAFVPARGIPAPLEQHLQKLTSLTDLKTVYIDEEQLRAITVFTLWDGVGEPPMTPHKPVLPYTGASAMPLAVETPDPNVVVISPLWPQTFFVLSDIWYPGWHCYQEEGETPILRVDHSLRGSIAMQPRVPLVYYPASFAVGAFVTCLCVMLIACGLVMGRRR